MEQEDRADRFASIGQAVSLAARAHRHQLRKDRDTPYIAHPVRACLVIRHVFGIDAPVVPAAAVLHDMTEDTTTEFDEVVGLLGAAVADCVAAMSEDPRLLEAERVAAYLRRLVSTDWRVAVCRLSGK